MIVYYIQNEKQYRRLLVGLLPKIDDWNLTANIDIYGCDYGGDDIDGDCAMCELDNCVLLEHLNDKDVTNHIKLFDYIEEYPVIMVVTDSSLSDKMVEFVPVSVAKENRKYGVW